MYTTVPRHHQQNDVSKLKMTAHAQAKVVKRRSRAYPNLPMSLVAQESGKPPWLSALSILLNLGMRVITKIPYAV